MDATSLGQRKIAELEEMGPAYENLAEIAFMLATDAGYSEEEVPELTVRDIFGADDE